MLFRRVPEVVARDLSGVTMKDSVSCDLVERLLLFFCKNKV